MTGSGSGAPGRDMTAGPASRRGIGRQLLIVLAIGLVLRLIIAYLLPNSGFSQDLGAFRFWASNLATQGPWGFYQRDFFHDYTPGYLYVLWLVGIVGQFLGGVGDLIKVPPVLADLALGYLVYSMADELGVPRRLATAGAAIVVLNPITWFDSVVWGQADSFGVVFLLLAIRELWRGRHERAAILAVVAALIKPQLGILVPVVAFVTIRRALWPEAEPPPPSGTAWERETAGLVRVLTTALAGLLTAIVLSAPFGLSLPGLVGQIFSTAAGYPYVTVNAYNAWALLPLDGQSLATNGGWILDAPRAAGEAYAAVAGVPALVIGSVALLASLLVVPLLIARRPEPLTILVGVSVLALAFFGLPTRVHERYLFPLFALTAVLATFSWRWRIAYAVASVATFLNMYVVLTTIYDNSGQGIHDWLGIGNAVRSFWGVALIAVAHTAVLAWGFAQLRAGAARSLAAELEGSGSDDRRPDEEREPGVSAEARPATGATLPGPAAPAATAASAVAAALPPARPATAVTGPAVASAARRVPAWYDRPWMAELGPIGWIRARMSETPIRPDRSRQLEREGGGRLDRLDLWIVVVIVVAALGLRMFRLAEPARMHFDEVYHARTATEFLQDWRYGIPHTIYEWTHPHLAKYAMALGIVLFAGHDVQASSDLGVTIRDAAIEPRRAGAESATAREGDRAWVVTGSELIGYDLETRAVAARFPLPGASAVAFDTNALDLLVGTDSGEVWALDATMLDLLRGSNPADPPVDPQLVGTLDGPIRRIAGFDGGQRIAALLPDDAVAVMDLGTGSETGRVAVAGAADLLDAGSGDAVVASPVDVVDPAAVASRLASILGGDAAAYQADLAQADADTVVIDAELTADVRSAIQDAIDAGTLPGIRIEPTPVLAVAGSGGVTFVSGRGTITARVPLTGGASGLALVSGVDEGTQLWATTRDDASGDPEVAVIAVSGDQAKSGPNRTDTVPLPGAGSKLVFDDAAQMVEVLGVAPDDSAPTVYVIETHGKAVYADHRLPFTPVAWALDHDGAYPTSSRGQILAFGGRGETAAIDIGHYPFAWRLPGVVLGALTAGIIYLLTRVLFRRREVAVLAGLFVLLDGMFFVQSRIAMNDVYTAAFILAAYLLFATLWLEPRRRWSFWLLMPVIGGLLGLALASKWVAAYAIGALGILVLLRSALGRLILIAGMIGMTGVLGWLALAVPPDSGGMGNLTFAIIMVALTLSTVALAVYRPIAWSDEEMWLAVAGPGALGIIVVLGAIGLGRAGAAVTLGPLSVTPIAAGFALVVAGLAMYAAFQVAGRLGFGPMAASTAARPPSGVPPAAPPAEGWLRLGSGLGLPIVWMLGSLIVIPVVVYVISYIPWTFIDSHRLWPGMPPGNTGQTLLDLTGEMYRYHNNLTAAHPASSPWWAWPLNLKPVWFYQGSFANSTAASIYDAGNMVIWWLGIPATVFVAWQAYRRRSLPLALIVIGLLAQWISWARIDRAAFEYHYYTSLPFVVMALAYFVAELWHGASRRTWLLARISAGVALMGPVLLWLVRLPMCQLANVQAVNQGSQACVVSTAGSLVITPSTAATAVVGVVTLLVLVRLLMRLGQPSDIGRPVGAGDLVPLVVTALAGGALLAVSRVLPSTDPLVSLPGIVPELIAFVVGLPLLLVVAQVVTARDARRFVIGIVAAAAISFVVLYPNVSALPLPSTLVNAYQGLLPTYLYAFQFAVNTVDRSGLISFSDPRFAILMVFLVISSVVVAYAAWVWRASLATDVAEEPADSAPTGPAGEAGAA